MVVLVRPKPAGLRQKPLRTHLANASDAMIPDTLPPDFTKDRALLLCGWTDRVSEIFLLEKATKVLNLGLTIHLLAEDMKIARQVTGRGLIDHGRGLPQRVEKQIQELAVRATDANTRWTFFCENLSSRWNGYAKYIPLDRADFRRKLEKLTTAFIHTHNQTDEVWPHNRIRLNVLRTHSCHAARLHRMIASDNA